MIVRVQGKRGRAFGKFSTGNFTGQRQLSVLRTKFPDATTLPHELTEVEMQRDERTGPLVEAKRVEGLARRIFLVPWTRISRLHFMD